MHFTDHFYEQLERAEDLPLVTEVQNERLVPATGKELSLHIAKIRHYLEKKGVKPQDRVVFVASNSIKWVALDMAVLFEGAISVPLYTRQSPSELAGMIRDCDPALVLVEDENCLKALQKLEVSALPFEDIFSLEGQKKAPVFPLEDDSPVTLIYTSGTSGEPKGVLYNAANVDFMLPVIGDAINKLVGSHLPPGERERVFHYLPFCFAGSRMVLWMTLYRGSGIILSRNLEQLVKEMALAKPHYYLNVPFLLERVELGVEGKLKEKPAFIFKLWQKARQAYAKDIRGKASLSDKLVLAIAKPLLFKKIKTQIGENLICLISGSAVLPERTQEFFEMLELPVYQVYGLTETTAIVTLDQPDAPLVERLGQVGWPIPGVEVRLGEGDELECRGPNVFPLYWGREEATQESRTEDGWFKTGDQAELHPNGSIRLIGRLKNLLVLRSGHNVAPEPIEEQLLAIDGIEQAVVFGHREKNIVALIVSKELSKEEALKAIAPMNEGLPFYMRVRNVHVLKEELSYENGALTANQKLKRKAIQESYESELRALWDEKA